MCRLKVSSSQRTRSRASGAPPTIRVRVPFSAAAAPPEIPASRNSTPRPANSSCRARVEAGWAVLRSTTTCPGRTWASRPSPPLATASMAGLSGSESRTISTRSTSSATPAAAGIPAAAILVASRSWPIRVTPWSRMRRPIRLPMLPTPIKPTGCIAHTSPPSSRPTSSQAHRQPVEVAAQARKALHDHRIVAGDHHPPLLLPQLTQAVVAAVHPGQVGEDREGHVALHLLLVVDGVGGQHHPAPVPVHHGHLLAGAVATDEVGPDPRKDLLAVLHGPHSPLPPGRAQLGHLGRLDVLGELGAGGVGAGPELQLGERHAEAGPREGGQVADVIVVEVGHDHVGHVPRMDAETFQGPERLDQDRAAAPPPHLRVEAGVDQDDPPPAPQHPEVVVHAQGRVRLAVGLVPVERLPARGHPGRVPDRHHLVAVRLGHLATSFTSRCSPDRRRAAVSRRETPRPPPPPRPRGRRPPVAPPSPAPRHPGLAPAPSPASPARPSAPRREAGAPPSGGPPAGRFRWRASSRR